MREEEHGMSMWTFIGITLSMPAFPLDYKIYIRTEFFVFNTTKPVLFHFTN